MDVGKPEAIQMSIVRMGTDKSDCRTQFQDCSRMTSHSPTEGADLNPRQSFE